MQTIINLNLSKDFNYIKFIRSNRQKINISAALDIMKTEITTGLIGSQNITQIIIKMMP